MNIRTKLFTGFAVVVVISAAMGANAVKSIYDVSSLTNRLYEHPLMSISFARSAQTHFIKMNLSLNLALSSADASEFEDRLAAAEEFEEEFGSDLEVVEERILNEAGAAIVVELARLLEQWAELRETIVEAGGPEMSGRTELSLRKDALARLTEEKIDLLIEASTREGYNFILSTRETNDFTLVVQLVAVLVAVAAGFLASLYLGRGIARPIIAMTAAMTKLADGDHEIAVPAVGRKDEIGDMAAAVQVFKENAERTLAAEKALRDAHNTLEQRVDERTAARQDADLVQDEGEARKSVVQAPDEADPGKPAEKPRPPDTDESSGTCAVGEGPDVPLFNETNLAVLRTALGEEELHHLLRLIPDEAATCLHRIRAAVDEGNLEAAQRAAHNLKGMAGNFAASRVEAIAREIEIEAASVEAVSRRIFDLEEAVKQTHNAIAGMQ